LSWDLGAKTIRLSITSVVKQEITLKFRRGIDSITAPAGVIAAPVQAGSAECKLQLAEGKAVEISLNLA
jgi:hypothetical protein